ncbi:MAG: dinitrogenase iron-molybdenum cofactor biosynthesis protein [Desulfobulbaceae bacterium]|nr:dinitrogenase iron-molybdenum cofactor biosynthesis protein [Desulfobulbaceae bacterium]
MNTTIAIPTEADTGLTGSRSDHFGHSKMFTLVTMSDNDITKVESLANKPHEKGGCMNVIKHLQDHGVDTVIAGGMGNGPFRGLQNAGIKVLFADSAGFPDVQSAIDGMLQNKLTPMEMRQLCKGGGNCHETGHPSPPQE